MKKKGNDGRPGTFPRWAALVKEAKKTEKKQKRENKDAGNKNTKP